MNLVSTLRNQYKAFTPDWLRELILVRRRSHTFSSAGVVFIHIPKAAGSSINQAIYGKFMGHIRAKSILSYASNEIAQLPRFAVTRNPWDRLVSSWRFAKQGGGSGNGVTAGIRNAKSYSHPVFDRFDTFVKDWLCKQSLSRIDGVFRPQSDYVLTESGELLVDHLGTVEALPKTEEWLSRTLGRNLVFPHSNRSGDAVNYREFYDPDLISIVEKLYARDISAFGYQFD
jgi:chondroitin 4-sulfotransferase 11